MSKFVTWYRTYQSEITWWIIGFLTWSVLDSLAKGNYIMTLINTVLIYINYRLWKSDRS